MKTIPNWANNSLSKLAKLASASEKHKALLDLGESFLNKLAGQVLGEYHFANLQDMKVEKELYLRENDLLSGKSVSLGHYCSLIQKAAQSLESAEKNSILKQAIVFNKRDKKALNSCEEFTKLRDFFKGIKAYSETGSEASIENFFSEFTVDEPPLSANLVEFFLIFPQLRNRFAHPHYDIRDKKTGEILKSVEWPLGDSYYQIANPLLEQAILKAIDLLSSLWQQPLALVSESDDENYTVLIPNGAEGQKTKIAQPARPLKSNALLYLSTENKVQFCVDFHYNLYCSEAAKKEIIAEEERKENEAIYAKNKDQLSKSITEFLEDGVIDLEEYGLLRAVAINNLDMSEESLKDLICAIAANLGIDDPFPAVDPKYLEKLDEALKAGNLNRLKLKLEGERFGVEAAKFESLLQERCELLEIDITELGESEEYMLSQSDLSDISSLVKLTTWLYTMKNIKSNIEGVKVYEVTKGQSEIPDSKEHTQKQLWQNLSDVFDRRSKSIAKKSSSDWVNHPNQWSQMKNMASYYWLRIYPLQSKGFGRALHMLVELNEYTVTIGLALDWDAMDKLKKFAIFEAIIKAKLKNFLVEYGKEIAAYPDIRLRSSFRGYRFTDYQSSVENLVDYHISLNTADNFSLNFGNLEKFIHSNPNKIFEIYEINYTLFANILESAQSEYSALSAAYRSPFTGQKGLLKMIVDKQQDLVKPYTKLSPKQARSIKASYFIDRLNKKKKNKFTTELEYGVWLSPNAAEPMLGFRLRAYAAVEKTVNTKESYQLDENSEAAIGINNFNNFIDSYLTEQNSTSNSVVAKDFGFFAFHVPIKFEEYENELNVVLAELEKVLKAMKESQLDFLDFGK